MKSKFSIGEVAKIHNITVETLRHYDRVGLLKPSYINSNTRYRYYNAKDFIILDLIKQCKAMGLSLEEIKNIIENYTSPESVLHIIRKQKEIVNEKIKELNNIKENIKFLEENISVSLDEGLNKISIKFYDKRDFIKYNNSNRFTEEFEVNLSKILAEIERKYTYFNKELGFVISCDELKKSKEVVYKNAMIKFTQSMDIEEYDKIILPAGRYLTLNFDDDYNDTKKYYNIMMDFIDKNNIKVLGDFYEIYIITRVGTDGSEKSLGKIQILIE